MPDPRRIFEKTLAWVIETRCRPGDLWVLVVYALLIGFGIWHHEPWSDEALPWIIARDTDWRGFLEMIFQNWDRHPGLFHGILYPFVKLGFPYSIQTLLNALLALGAAFLFLAKAPFPRIFRWLFLFSYYMAYEYSVITRPYMLAVAFLFTVAAVYPSRGNRPIFFAALVALLFHTDYMGFGLAAGITLVFFLEHKKALRTNPRLGVALALMIVSSAMAAWMAHAIPAGHGEYGLKLPFDFRNGVKPLANAFFPFSDLGRHAAVAFPAAVLGGAAALILAFFALARKPGPSLILGVSLAYLFTVFLFFHGGDFRNHGFILLSVLFALWIAFDPAGDPSGAAPSPNSFSWAARAVLTIAGLCLLLGFQNLYFVYLLEYRRPFSGARDMARVIAGLEKQQKIFEQGFIIVAPHKNSVGLMPYLPGVRFWNPCSGDYAEYFRSTQAMKVCNDLPEAAALALTRNSFGDLSRCLFLFRNPLPFPQDADYEYQRVYAVPEAFGHWQESFYLYRALPKRAHGNAK